MVKEKALEKVSEAADNKMNLINEHTIEPLTEEQVFTFDVVLCDNDLDREYDAMTNKFLDEFTEKSSSLVGLKDHDWSADNQLARLYAAEVVDTDEVNFLGEKRRYVLGHAYTLRRNEDFVERINSGLLNHCSVSFNSSGDVCSICGCATHKEVNGHTVCENGHVAGEDYDGKLCYNIINQCDDVFEWSLVAVPCQRKAGIKNKGLGGLKMKKSAFIMARILKNKSLPEELRADLEKVSETSDEVDVNEEDVKALIEENEKLKAELEATKKELEAIKESSKSEKICGAVEKAVDELEPINDQVKADIIEKIDTKAIDFDECGNAKGLAEQIEELKVRYKGLFKSDIKAAEDAVAEQIKAKAAAETEAEAKKKTFNPSFGVGKKSVDTGKKSFHEACEKTFN